MTTSPDAWLLDAADDVGTAVRPLPAGTRVEVRCRDVGRDVTLVDAIPSGHKFALRPLAAGMRIRKYGEYIGRTTQAIDAGAFVHEHNLATTARRSPDLERAWARAQPPRALRSIGRNRCSLGESPVWSERDGRLYFVDLRDTPAIHALDPDSADEARWPMPEDIGCIVPSTGRTLIAGLRSGFATFDPASGRLEHFLDPEAEMPGTRLNDGKCDRRGRLWCGSMNPDSALAEGSLYVLEGFDRCARVLGDWL
ncbi:MAG TPA: SMP-30/gluconolactonase/LRE family protein, partial [Casimicrobiaceae bacterium]|nr:SMP-30/gluconolactonase/LRE family protein [Casimicrobiaceae bacterium]